MSSLRMQMPPFESRFGSSPLHQKQRMPPLLYPVPDRHLEKDGPDSLILEVAKLHLSSSTQQLITPQAKTTQRAELPTWGQIKLTSEATKVVTLGGHHPTPEAILLAM